MQSLFKKARERKAAKEAAKAQATTDAAAVPAVAEKYGIEETKDLVKFSAKLVNGIIKSLKDKVIKSGDFIHFLPAGMALPSAFIGAQNLPNEFSDLSENERIELVGLLDDELEIENEEQERLIIEAVNCQTRFVAIVLKLSKMKNPPPPVA